MQHTKPLSLFTAKRKVVIRWKNFLLLHSWQKSSVSDLEWVTTTGIEMRSKISKIPDEVLKLRRQGLSLRKIAKRVKASPASVYKILVKSSPLRLEKSILWDKETCAS
jgi:hypothetical protein